VARQVPFHLSFLPLLTFVCGTLITYETVRGRMCMEVFSSHLRSSRTVLSLVALTRGRAETHARADRLMTHENSLFSFRDRWPSPMYGPGRSGATVSVLTLGLCAQRRIIRLIPVSDTQGNPRCRETDAMGGKKKKEGRKATNVRLATCASEN
jgi:hypothetical protein